MNYTANTTHWPIGSLVVHDADAKDICRCDGREYTMLMRVVSYAPNGWCVTEYVDDDSQRRWGPRGRSRLINRSAVLHDPRQLPALIPVLDAMQQP